MIVVFAPEIPWIIKKVKSLLINAGERADVVTLDTSKSREDVRCVLADLDDPSAVQMLTSWVNESDAAEPDSTFSVLGLSRSAASEYGRLSATFGIDDFVHTDELERLGRRLSRVLSTPVADNASAARSWILLSGGQDGGLNNLSRALARAGFSTRYARSRQKTAAEILANVWDAWIIHGRTDASRLAQELIQVRNHPRLHHLPIVVNESGRDLKYFVERGVSGPLAVTASTHDLSRFYFILRELLRDEGSPKAKRFLSPIPARFRADNEMWWESGLTHDLSSNGVFVRTLCPPEIGATVTLQLNGEGYPALELRGVITRSNALPIVAGGVVPAGFGVRLVGEVADDYHKLIERLESQPKFLLQPDYSTTSLRPLSDEKLVEALSMPPPK